MSDPAISRRSRRARRPRPSVADERLADVGSMTQLLRRPEIGAAARRDRRRDLLLPSQRIVFLKLDGIANWTDVASTIGIPAVAVALLMIGGEFDLSAGVMTGTAGLMMGILATEVGMNIWLAIVLTFVFAGDRSASSTATWS